MTRSETRVTLCNLKQLNQSIVEETNLKPNYITEARNASRNRKLADCLHKVQFDIEAAFMLNPNLIVVFVSITETDEHQSSWIEARLVACSVAINPWRINILAPSFLKKGIDKNWK